MCRGCRMPLSLKEKKSIKYEAGVSCPYCYNKLTKSQKDRFQ
jgi:Predicted sulfurtransferase